VEETGESSASIATASTALAPTTPASPAHTVSAATTFTADGVTTIVPATKPRKPRKVVTPWTQREDALLIEAIEKFGAKFAEVKKFVEREGNGEVKQRAAFGYQSRWRILKKRILDKKATL